MNTNAFSWFSFYLSIMKRFICTFVSDKYLKHTNEMMTKMLPIAFNNRQNDMFVSAERDTAIKQHKTIHQIR